MACTDMSQDPKTYAEAMAQPDANKWELACKDELRSFHNMDIYKLVPWLWDRKVVGSKWVLHRKFGPNGSIQKYKAQIVAQVLPKLRVWTMTKYSHLLPSSHLSAPS